MWNIIRVEYAKMKLVIFVTITLSIIIGIGLIIPYIEGYKYFYNIEIWEQSSDPFTLLFPLIAVLPGNWLMYYERKNNFINYAALRASKKRYYLVKWIFVATLAGFSIFLISFSGLLFSLYGVHEVSTTGYDYSLSKYLGEYFVYKPVIYGLTLSLWRGFLGFLISSFSFVLSMFIDNLFAILIVPFSYVIIENFTFSILDVPQYRIVTSFSPDMLTPAVINIPNLLMGPSALIIITMTILMLFRTNEKKLV